MATMSRRAGSGGTDGVDGVDTVDTVDAVELTGTLPQRGPRDSGLGGGVEQLL